MSDTDWVIVVFFSVFLVVGIAGMWKVLRTPDASPWQMIGGLLFFTPFVIVGAVPLIGAISLYMGSHFAPDAPFTRRPWQYPAGAYYPTFCSFGAVGLQKQPPWYSLNGSSRLTMERALAYVEEAEWPAGWRRYEHIIQKDAVNTGFTNGSIWVAFSFIKNADGSSDCFLYWPREE